MQNYKYDFSIVVPIYNEIKNLSPLTDSIMNELNEDKYNYQIIYVDDGSQDGTSQKIDLLQEKIDKLSAIHFTENNGQTAAFLAGFQRSGRRVYSNFRC